MSENARAARRLIHSAVEAMIDTDPPGDEDGPSIVRSWALVATLSYADGGSQMYRISSDATGDSELPVWERDGLMHYALYDFVPSAHDDD